MILTLIIALLGFPIGIFIASATKEELEKGKRYFYFTKETLFFLITVISLIYLLNKIYYFLIVFGLSIIIYLVQKKVEGIRKTYSLFIPYLLFITIYYINTELTPQLITASLIFIYGLITGTLYYELSKKRS